MDAQRSISVLHSVVKAQISLLPLKVGKIKKKKER